MNTDSKSIPIRADDDHSKRYHDKTLLHKAHVNAALFAITSLAGLAYLIWAILNIDYNTWYVGIPYLFAEIFIIGSLLISGGTLIHRREHPPQGMLLEDPPPPVDIVVTCCGEPCRVIEKTLRAVWEINYPDYKVTVADDHYDPEVAQICRDLGFFHLCRSRHEDRKAGNLNFAYTHTSNPFLLVLDSDQIPHHSILKGLMGYFSVPHIGFVTTYQGFDVPKGDPWGNRDRVYYGAMQPARNDSNSAISSGSGVIYRRAALNQIGGFSTWNLVEHLYSSLLMHAAGWKSVYHPFPFTHGTAPADITTHARQRWQWAFDALRLFFWRNPIFTKGLSFRQKLSYFGFGYNYLIFGLAYPILFLIPIFGLFSGSFIMDTSVAEFLIWRTPYVILYLVLNRYLTDKRNNSKAFRSQIGLFQVFLSAIIRSLFSRKHIPKYKVSQKLVQPPGMIDKLYHVSGHITIISLCIGGIIYGCMTNSTNLPHYYVNSAWALWVVWLLMPFTILGLKPPPSVDFR